MISGFEERVCYVSDIFGFTYDETECMVKLFEERNKGNYGSAVLNGPVSQFFTENICEIRNDVMMLSTIIYIFLRDEAVNFSDFSCLYNPNGNDTILLINDYQDALERISSYYSGGYGSCFYELKGNTGTGRKSNIRKLSERNQRNAVFCNIARLMDTEDSEKRLREELMRSLLSQSYFCFVNDGNRDEETEFRNFCRNSISVTAKYMSEIYWVGPSDSFICRLFRKGDVFWSDNINYFEIKFNMPSLSESEKIWRYFLKERFTDVNDDISVNIAGTFTFSPGTIKKIIEEYMHERILQEERLVLQDIFEVCRRYTEGHLDNNAHRVPLFYDWEQLVLPDKQKSVLKMACSYIKNRVKVFSEWGFDEKINYGTGLSIMMSGPPGTGKTMAAQVVAKELGQELYRVELSKMVSKYIGETEKNLKGIFEEAAGCQCVLFFDEADVLFGRRTEVKDSNDKYSNMEAAFLLQQIENYNGVIILATNFLQNLDAAFIRRIKFVIEFPMPDYCGRLKLWRNSFPVKSMENEEIDFEYLADRFKISGSNIKNIAMNAAFIAASENVRISMCHILRGVANEYEKSGKILKREDFGRYGMFFAEN